MKSNRNSFEPEFLEKYLKYGLGSLPKSDIDALIMYLLDKHGFQDSKSLSKLSNQEVSEKSEATRQDSFDCQGRDGRVTCEVIFVGQMSRENNYIM
jgi:hypothetical protein